VEERVLLVEDDASIPEATALGLEAVGSRATGAPEGRAERAARHRTERLDLLMSRVRAG
jgi:hypothetical protein